MSYASIIATAQRLIQDKGAACIWRATTPVIGPSVPWREAGTATVDYPTFVVLLPFDSVARRMFGYGQGSTIPQGVRMGLMPGSTDFVPALRDTVVVGATTYTIGAFDVMNPDADKDIIYTLELHR